MTLWIGNGAALKIPVDGKLDTIITHFTPLPIFPWSFNLLNAPFSLSPSFNAFDVFCLFDKIRAYVVYPTPTNI